MVQWKQAYKERVRLRDRGERRKKSTTADEIDLFSERKGQVSKYRWREGAALENKTFYRAGNQAVHMTAVLCLFSKHST